VKKVLLILPLAAVLAGIVVFLKLPSRVNSLSAGNSGIEGVSTIQSAPSCNTAGTIEYMYYSEGNPEKNNKFGLYVYAEEKKYIELADELVNSSGGDWGYVLIPYNVRDRDYNKWRDVFELLNKKHLIPVIQLWDVNPDKYEKETQEAAEFLNSFVWPIKERYVSVYNEPNDAKFWRGKLDPKEYARVLRYTIAAFKKENTDFFMLNGAFNASAGNVGTTMDAEHFMRIMNEEVPDVFSELDGWASHSYPQPNFSGSPRASGRWSIKAYEEELEFLQDELGVEKELPVFITETGWAHAEGELYNSSYLPVNQIAENFKWAFENVWLKDEKVRAVMPFTVWYEPPFDHFSWVNHDKVPYFHFDEIKKMKKVKGEPSNLMTGTITSIGCE
jgi:hypothetical protein